MNQQLNGSAGSSAADSPAVRAEKVRSGNVRVASRLISQIQDGDGDARAVVRILYPDCGHAKLIGITGAPGAGKSTLVGEMICELRKRNLTVGVVAIDPSSPFSGGAVLGDRDRMEGYTSDEGVFIRSLASRGATGGLCAVANDAVDVMDAMGKDVILIETVGVGQSEVKISQIANAVVLTLVPGYGDSLQAMKAGVMEIGDILVMNKADCEGAESAVKDLQGMDYYQAVPEGDEMWKVPVVKTVAMRGEGVDELIDVLFDQEDFAARTGWKRERQRARRSTQFVEVLTDRIRYDFVKVMKQDEQVGQLIAAVETMSIDPYTASTEIFEKIEAALGSGNPRSYRTA